MQINELIANRSNYGSKRSVKNINFVCLHYTGNYSDLAQNNAKYFHNNNIGVSAHYFVGEDGIWRSVPDDYVAWSVGGGRYNTGGGRLFGVCTNNNSLSIELCDERGDDKLYPSAKAVNLALELVRAKMNEYGIDKSHVIRHYDVNGKPCPMYWTNDARWYSEFHNSIVLPPKKKEPIKDNVKNAVYRLYNTKSGEHMFTRSTSERDNLYNLGWFYEGIAWISADKNGTPVYRLYNPNTGEHFYTMSGNEKSILVKLGWRDEGIAFYSDKSKKVPVYRLSGKSFHMFTTAKVEKEALLKAKYTDEGVGFYAAKLA